MKANLRIWLSVSIVFVLSLLIAELPILKVLSLRIYDSVITLDYVLKHSETDPVYDAITIVDIDERSISTLGQFSSWPNLFFADVVDIISADAPKAIGFDLFFTESDSLGDYTKERLLKYLALEDTEHENLISALSSDQYFSQSIANAGNVFLAMFNSSQPRKDTYIPPNLYGWDIKPSHHLIIEHPYSPIPVLAESAYGVGFAHIKPDESGVIHDYPLFLAYKDRQYVNFSFQICLDLMQIDSIAVKNDCTLYSEGSIKRQLPLCNQGKHYIKYYGPEGAFRYVPFSDVLLGRVPPGYFKDKIILIGSSAAGLRDFRTTPLDSSFPGVELHATFMRNLIEEDYVHWLNEPFSLVILYLLILVAAYFVCNSKTWVSILYFIVLSFIIVAAFYWLYYSYSYMLNYSRILSPWVLCFIAMIYQHYTRQLIEKKKVRFAFEHYVSKDVISQIMADASALKIGGAKKEVSVLFADIRNFSTYCEQSDASDITAFLHRYFNLATQRITLQRGLLDKYIGDAIVALFNVPFPYPDYQYQACVAALDIVSASLQVKSEYAEHPIFSSFKIGVGVSSGELIIGNMGSDAIFNYTGIGDKMNLCSRLEGLNKFYGTSIIIDCNTYLQVKDRLCCRHLDRVSVKGKSQYDDIYELVGSFVDTAITPEYIAAYETALKTMIDGDLELAKVLFEKCKTQCPSDLAVSLMLERLKEINKDQWTGVWQHQSK